MEKIIKWYCLMFKVFWGRRSYRIEMLFLSILVLTVHFMSFPVADNLNIGICFRGEELSLLDSNFNFVYYDNEEDLIDDVLSGKLDSGFVFDKKITKKIYQDDFNNIVEYISSPATKFGEVAKESITTNLFMIYSDKVSKDKLNQMFSKQSEELSTLYETNTENYLRSGDLFSAEFNRNYSSTNSKNYYKLILKTMILLGYIVYFVMTEKDRIIKKNSVVTYLVAFTPLLVLAFL